MSGYGPTPTDGSVIPIPLSSAVSPGDKNPYAVQGGPKAVDSQGNTLVPLSLYVYDGNDVTFGAQADVTATSDSGTFSFMALFKRLLAKFPVIGPQPKSSSMSVTIATDQPAIPTSLAVGTALTPYGSNPSQTAAAGADTLYKFGAAGTTPFNHVSGQNNTAANVYLAFDQSTTIAGNQVYTIAPGQAYAFDRQGTVLHFSSPAQQSFGGLSGVTVEAFA